MFVDLDVLESKEFNEEVRETVSFFFDDAEEIGSSDISCCVRSVVRNMGWNYEELSNGEIALVRMVVQSNIR